MLTRFIPCLALVALIAVPPGHVFAAEPADVGLDDYWVTRWERTGGPAAELVLAMVQDREGYLWLGSTDGLTRFDGFSFDRWPQISRVPLAGASVRTLFIDLGGALWVGFDNGGVSRISGTSVRNFGPDEGLPEASVRAFAQDSEGTMWAGSIAGLFRLQNDAWDAQSAALGLPEGPVLSALYDSTGSLFVGTPEAIFRRRAGSGTFEQLIEHPVSSSVSQSLCKDSHGHVVTTDATRGLLIVDGATEHPLPPTAGVGLRIVCSRGGTIWVGTRLTGLWRVAPAAIGQQPAVGVDLLGQQAALAVFEDRDQNVWVASNAGLSRLTPRNVRTLRDVRGPTALAADPSGRMWVGTVDGLLQLTRRSAEWVRTAHHLQGQQVRSVQLDAAGTVWVATPEGVSGVSPAGTLTTPAWGPALRQVTSITANAEGAVWIFDERAGLGRYHDGRFDPLELAPELRGHPRTVIHADRRNRLWIVNDGGVEIRGQDGDARRYTPADGLEHAQYRSVYEDSAGVVWLGSTLGLSRLVDGRIESVSIPGARRGAWVKTITEDRQGRLWLGIDRGGLRLTRASFQNALRTPAQQLDDNFEVFDGLPGTIRALSDRLVAQTPDGQLWFTTDEGVALVDAEGRQPDLGVVPARIARAEADDTTIDASQAARLAPGTSRLHLAWAALDLTAPERVRFRYRLDGFDRDWREAGTAREVEYANLPPGAYVFRVAAAREGDPWTDASGSSWEFSVAPRIYQTVWFPFLAAALVASASWATWHLRLVQARRRFAITLAERARVSREVHDTLLQSLVGVALQCQALADGGADGQVRNHLVQLRRRIDEHIEEGRELIWNLRSPTLEKYDLVAALRRMADDTVDGTDVRVEFVTSGKVRSCAPRVEREILRIGQEAITNAVRHGRPTVVRIELQFEDRRLCLRVTDDGAGFVAAEAMAGADGHCGLMMMRERAEDIGGRCTITSTPGAGTCVDASAPLPAGA